MNLPANKRPPPAGRMMTKAEFLTAFGHGPDYHVRWHMRGKPDADIVDGEIMENRLSAAEEMHHKLPMCGWWFCEASEDDVNWGELEKARQCLNKAGVDWHGPRVAELGYVWANTTRWANEQRPAEALARALESVRSETSHHWQLEEIRRTAKRALDSRLTYALDAAPEDGGSTKLPRQKAIGLGVSWQWGYAEIAAALVLVGAEPLGDRGFAEARDRVRQVSERLNKRLKNVDVRPGET